MRKQKSPFLGYTMDEIRFAEANLYVIQVGEDLHSHDGEVSFPKNEANYHYDMIFKSLGHMAKNGSFEEREDAHKMLRHFRIMPVRFH